MNNAIETKAMMDRTRIRGPPTDDLMKQLLRRIVRFLLSFPIDQCGNSARKMICQRKDVSMNAQEIRTEVERRCKEALPQSFVMHEWRFLLAELSTLTDENIPTYITYYSRRLPGSVRQPALRRVIEETLTLLDPQGGRCQGCSLWVPKTTLQVVAAENDEQRDLYVCDTCVG